MKLFNVSLLSSGILGLVAFGEARQAHACSQEEGPRPWAIQPAQAGDQVAPTITAHAATINRMKPITDPGNSCYGADFSALSIQLTSADDIAAAEQIGYELKVVAGALPPSMTIPSGVLVPKGNFRFSMKYNEPYGIAFTLEVRAVDGNGNRSLPLTIVVDDTQPPIDEEQSENNAGCATNSQGALAGTAMLVGILAIVGRRRRR